MQWQRIINRQKVKHTKPVRFVGSGSQTKRMRSTFTKDVNIVVQLVLAVAQNDTKKMLPGVVPSLTTKNTTEKTAKVTSIKP